MKPWKRLVCLMFAAFLAVSPAAYAQSATYKELECNDKDGTVKPGTTLFDADPDNDPVNKTGACEYRDKPVITHVFSYVICDFVQILDDVMDSMYCGMHHYLVDTIGVLLTLYLVTYGAQVLMGTQQISTRDAVVRMLKLSFVFVFATQSAWAISFIFNFFMGVIGTSVGAVLSTLGSAVAGDPNDNICSFDSIDSNDIMSLYNFLDYIVCHALLGPASQVNTRVQGFFLSMAFALPPMYLLFQWWIITTVKTLVITLIAFLKSLAAIAFLVTLSPFFLGFYLFQSTAFLFENWLRYLISFSVEICLVMAIIVLWVLTINQFVGFFNELSKLVYPYTPTLVVGGVYKAPDDYAICNPNFGTDKNGAPTAWCNKGFDANPPEYIGGVWQPPVNPNWRADNKKLAQPSELISNGEFIYYIFFHMGGLLLVSYSFALMLDRANELAKALAGPQSVPSLTPGWGAGIGSAKSFKSPELLAARAGDKNAVQKLSDDFHTMVTGR